MLARIAAFSFGVGLFWQLPTLPPVALLWLLPLLAVLYLRLSYGRLWLLFPAGFLWAMLHAAWMLSAQLPSALEGEDLVVQGVVASIPEQRGNGLRFQFQLEAAAVELSPGRVALTWYRNYPQLKVGERWQLKLRLKQPHGFMNPAGFDYEKWLFQQQIMATGYVRSGARDLAINQPLGQWDYRYGLSRLRADLLSRIQQALRESPFVGMVAALAIGHRQGMTDEQWRVLTATGTNHLMAISGLHVGLVAGLVFWLVERLWRCSANACLRWPAKKAAAVAAMLAALIYASLAGFSIPTQRALLMLSVAMLALLRQRQLPMAHILALAWVLVLLVDPLALLSVGFWLSFGAVALILYTMTGRTQAQTLSWQGLWWRWGRVHLMIGIGLIPLLVLFFQQAPLLSFFANLVAVPVVGILVVPLVLLGTLLLPLWPGLGELLLWGVDQLFDLLWPYLTWLAGFDGLLLQAVSPPWAIFPALLGMAWLLAPKGWPARWLGLLGVLPMLLIKPEIPEESAFWLTMLDVGQGLAVVVETRQHTLVYDVGPRIGEGFDTGDAVVAPYLKSRGLQSVARLVVSHDDIDHGGGLHSLMAQIKVEQLFTPQLDYGYANHQPCREGDSWQWDGVEFRFLHPAVLEQWESDNNQSCVLRVSNQAGSVLIPGDIERVVEQALLEGGPALLQSDLLIAPHHGSNSSSSRAFIEAVAPDYVLFASGYRNRYHFPDQRVLVRYRDAGVLGLESSRSGAIDFQFSPQSGISGPHLFRENHRRVWHRN